MHIFYNPFNCFGIHNKPKMWLLLFFCLAHLINSCDCRFTFNWNTLTHLWMTSIRNWWKTNSIDTQNYIECTRIVRAQCILNSNRMFFSSLSHSFKMHGIMLMIKFQKCKYLFVESFTNQSNLMNKFEFN